MAGLVELGVRIAVPILSIAVTYKAEKMNALALKVRTLETSKPSGFFRLLCCPTTVLKIKNLVVPYSELKQAKQELDKVKNSFLGQAARITGLSRLLAPTPDFPTWIMKAIYYQLFVPLTIGSICINCNSHEAQNFARS